jgi:hypothetical protein
MNDVAAIAQYIEENMYLDEEKGPVVGAILVHYGIGQETEVTSLTAQKDAALWAKPADMAAHFDKIARRHTAGVVGGGAQQFGLILFRSPSGSTNGERKASHVLPFQRIAPTGSMVGPGPAALASEPPTQAGMTMQAQRLLEIQAQGNFALSGNLFQQMMRFLELTVSALKEERTDVHRHARHGDEDGRDGVESANGSGEGPAHHVAPARVSEALAGNHERHRQQGGVPFDGPGHQPRQAHARAP